MSAPEALAVLWAEGIASCGGPGDNAVVFGAGGAERVRLRTPPGGGGPYGAIGFPTARLDESGPSSWWPPGWPASGAAQTSAPTPSWTYGPGADQDIPGGYGLSPGVLGRGSKRLDQWR